MNTTITLENNQDHIFEYGCLLHESEDVVLAYITTKEKRPLPLISENSLCLGEAKITFHTIFESELIYYPVRYSMYVMLFNKKLQDQVQQLF